MRLLRIATLALRSRDRAELRRTEGIKSNAIVTPVVGHGLVIASAGFPAKKVIAIRPGGRGDITGTDRIAWTCAKGTFLVKAGREARASLPESRVPSPAPRVPSTAYRQRSSLITSVWNTNSAAPVRQAPLSRPAFRLS